MHSAKKTITLLLLFFITFLPAADLKIGFNLGVNEFLTKSEVWSFNDLYESHLGYYYFDETGTSLHFGPQLFIGDHVAVNLQYHTPRRGRSYFYATEDPFPVVPYDPSMTVVQSFVSGFSTELRYYFFQNETLAPYLGLGAELAILNAADYVITDRDDPNDWRAITDPHFTELGTKVLGGFILPAGLVIKYKEHLFLDLEINYTFLYLKQWDVVGDVPVEQSLGGLYLKIGTGYNF